MKKEKGFTLVELLAAIVILGVLMATAAGAFGAIKKNNAKKELEQIAGSIKKIGETMYTSSVIKGENLFASNNITELEGSSLTKRIYEETPATFVYKNKKISCTNSNKCIEFSSESNHQIVIIQNNSIVYNGVLYTGDTIKGKELIESNTIENPYNKGKVCDIKLTLSKEDGKTVSQGCIICDYSKDIPDTETNLNICK